MSERERGRYCIRVNHSWASHIIARIGQWVTPLPISYTRLVIR